MTPEAAGFLDKSQDLISRAPVLLAKGFTDEAGRAAYLAAFHAAQALIFERLGRSPKSHSGVQAMFAQITKDDLSLDRELRAFLGRAYNLKAIADYGTGPDSRVTMMQASEAIRVADRFIGLITRMLGVK